MDDFRRTCTGCGIYKEICPFLSEYGTPDEILALRPEVSFYCTSGRRCESVCPLNLSPSVFKQQKGKQIYLHHPFLEYLVEEAPRRSVPSPLRQWINRLALATEAMLKTPKVLVLLIIVLLVAGGVYLNSQHVFSAKALTDLLGRHPVLAPIIFLGIYAFAPALFVPSIPLTVAAGFFWGPVWGVVFSISGATIGACLPFFLSRYLLQDFIKTRTSPARWKWLQDKVHQHGWKAVAFTRLIPVFPFQMLNYLFGLTPISFFQYLWCTFVFMLPACIVCVVFGSSLGALILHGNIKSVLIGIVVAVCALLIPLALRPFFRKVGDKKTTATDEVSGKEER